MYKSSEAGKSVSDLEAKRQKQVHEEMDRLDYNVELMWKEVLELEKKLESVLMAVPEGNSSVKDVAALCPLALRIHHITNGVIVAIDKIKDLQSRLEV